MRRNLSNHVSMPVFPYCCAYGLHKAKGFHTGDSAGNANVSRHVASSLNCQRHTSIYESDILLSARDTLFIQQKDSNMNDNTAPDSWSIMFHPDFEKLKAKVEKLREELIMLVLERDALIYKECKHIEMKYLLSVGALEYKAYEIECAILRLKRKVELIQANVNRQEEINLSEIEEILGVEFTEYQVRLNEQIEMMNKAIERSHCELLSKEESGELKTLYRAIVRALHPDLHPDLSAAKITLFQNAVEAYEAGDLNGLRIISAMVSEPDIPVENRDGFAVLIKEEERLTELIESMKNIINKIKSEYPYTMKPLVQSPEKIEARKAELELHITQLNEILSFYQARIEEMLGLENE